MDPDMDNLSVVRRTYLFQGQKDHLVPLAILQMARLAGAGEGRSGDEYPMRGGEDPLYRSNEMLIPYVGPPKSFIQISASDVLNSKIKDNFFNGKFILIGPASPELLDNFQTPTSSVSAMPSVEIQANILNAILNSNRVYSAPRSLIFIVSMSMVGILLLALVRLGPRQNLWLSAGLAVIPLAICVLGVALRWFWVPPSPYLTTLMIIVPYWGWRRLNAASVYFAREIRALEAESGVDALGARRLPVGGDVVLQQMTLLEDAKRRISDLREAFQAGDAPRALQAAHAIKGASGSFGARRLAQLCARLEAAAGPGRTAGLGTLVAAIEGEFVRVRAALSGESSASTAGEAGGA